MAVAPIVLTCCHVQDRIHHPRPVINIGGHSVQNEHIGHRIFVKNKTKNGHDAELNRVRRFVVFHVLCWRHKHAPMLQCRHAPRPGDPLHVRPAVGHLHDAQEDRDGKVVRGKPRVAVPQKPHRNVHQERQRHRPEVLHDRHVADDRCVVVVFLKALRVRRYDAMPVVVVGKIRVVEDDVEEPGNDVDKEVRAEKYPGHHGHAERAGGIDELKACDGEARERGQRSSDRLPDRVGLGVRQEASLFYGIAVH